MFATGCDLSRLADAFRAHGFDPLVPTLPRHAPEADPSGLSLLDYVSALEAEIDRQGWTRAPVIVGHSMGGLLAQALAARRSTAALVLLAPAPLAGQAYNPLPAFPLYAPMLAQGAFWRKAFHPAFESFARVALAGIDSREHARMYAGTVADSGRAIAEIAFWFLDRRHAARVDSDRIDCPVWLASGGLDRLVPASSVRATARRYPGATLRHWPDRGHILTDDDATEPMVDEIVAWLQANDLTMNGPPMNGQTA